MSTTQKLWLGFGLLLMLLVGSGLFVARRLALVEKALATIMAVQEPANAATYEMAVNVSGTESAVLAYVDTGSSETRDRVDSLLAGFDRLRHDYDVIARSRASRQLGAAITSAHLAFRSLSDTLMTVSDRRRREFDEFARASDAVSRVIVRELSNEPDARGRDAQKRALLVSQLDADMATMGAALGHFLRTRDPRHKTPIAEREAHFLATLKGL